jgi:hypothetical protein
MLPLHSLHELISMYAIVQDFGWHIDRTAVTGYCLFFIVAARLLCRNNIDITYFSSGTLQSVACAGFSGECFMSMIWSSRHRVDPIAGFRSLATILRGAPFAGQHAPVRLTAIVSPWFF